MEMGDVLDLVDKIAWSMPHPEDRFIGHFCSDEVELVVDGIRHKSVDDFYEKRPATHGSCLLEYYLSDDGQQAEVKIAFYFRVRGGEIRTEAEVTIVNSQITKWLES